MMHVGASGSGCTSNVALASASLTLEKAVTAVSFQARVLALLLVLARVSSRAGGGPRSGAQIAGIS